MENKTDLEKWKLNLDELNNRKEKSEYDPILLFIKLPLDKFREYCLAFKFGIGFIKTPKNLEEVIDKYCNFTEKITGGPWFKVGSEEKRVYRCLQEHSLTYSVFEPCRDSYLNFVISLGNSFEFCANELENYTKKTGNRLYDPDKEFESKLLNDYFKYYLLCANVDNIAIQNFITFTEIVTGEKIRLK